MCFIVIITDLRAYFKRKTAGSEELVAKKQIANPEMIIPATENIDRSEIEMVESAKQSASSAQVPKCFSKSVSHLASHSAGSVS